MWMGARFMKKTIISIIHALNQNLMSTKWAASFMLGLGISKVNKIESFSARTLTCRQGSMAH